MECDLCGEPCRKRDAKETVDGLACPDCAEGLKACDECGLQLAVELAGAPGPFAAGVVGGKLIGGHGR